MHLDNILQETTGYKSYGYSNYEEWNFGIVISTAKKNKGGMAIASKVFCVLEISRGNF